MSASSVDSLEQKVRAELERQLTGRVISLTRQERWRPAWFAEVERDGRIDGIYVRGARGGKYLDLRTLPEEADVNRILYAHGVPVPRVHGMVDDPPAIIMDRLSGRVNLAHAASDEQRDRILDQYIEAMTRMHAIDVREFGAVGLPVPPDNPAAALQMYRQGERNFRAAKTAPSPFIEFVWRWLQRNVPTGRDRRALIQADSAQFVYDGDRLTGLIDFEAAYIGDPIAEFAAMRTRDCEEPLGPISALARKYEKATGDHVDKKAVEFHTAGWCIMTPMQWEDSVRHPASGDSWLESFIWYNSVGRWGLEAIAEVIGAELAPLETPESSHPSSFRAGAYANLAALLAESPASDDYDRFRADTARSLARFAERLTVYGPRIDRANLDEIAALVGHRPDDIDNAEQALEEFVLSAGPDADADLVRYFHRWTLRNEFLVDGTGARHEKLIRTQPQSITDL